MNLRLLACATVALVAITVPVHAAKGAKGQKGGAKPGRVLARYDRDHNGVIDGQEVTRLQAVYASLSALDTDHNGQLSESEIAAAKVPVRKKAAAKASPTPPATPTPQTPAKPQ